MQLIKKKQAEQLTIGAILGFSLYIFLGSFQFSGYIPLFPRITSGLVLVTGAILLFRDYIPKIGSDKKSFEEQMLEDTKQVSDEEDRDLSTYDSDFNKDELSIIALVIGYVVGGVLVGLLWVTPIFVLAYTRWRGLSWIRISILTVISSAIPLVLMRYLNIDYTTGILLGGIL